MKHIIQIIAAVLIFAGLVLYSAVTASAAASGPAAGPSERLDSELPPIIFDEDCDGGDSCPGSVFTDMPAVGHWSHLAIDWALTRHITTGTSASTFSPGKGCTRAQAVMFLWKAFGSSAPETQECPFTDVSASAYYYKAVLWAYENQITTGVTETTFGPNRVCTRAQIVTFLWICKGKPTPANPSAEMPFQDVGARAYYRNAVMWAIQSGITSGTSATTFSPSKTCTRAQIVTFLYKTFRG